MIFYFNQISFEAYITVTWISGGVCTVSNGNVSYTAPNTSGSYKFTVEEEGTYTATVTVGSYTFTGSVSITENGQSKSLAVDCTLVLWGSNSSADEWSISVNSTGTSSCGRSKSGSNLHAYWSHNGNYPGVTITGTLTYLKNVPLTGYKTATIKASMSGEWPNAKLYVGGANVKINETSSQTTYSLDVSNVSSGNISVSGTAAMNQNTHIYISSLVLK